MPFIISSSVSISAFTSAAVLIRRGEHSRDFAYCEYIPRNNVGSGIRPLTGPSGHLSPMKNGGEEWREIAAGSPPPLPGGEVVRRTGEGAERRKTLIERHSRACPENLQAAEVVVLASIAAPSFP